MAVLNGNDLVVAVGSDVVGVNQTCSFSISTDLIEQNTQSSGLWVTRRAGRKSATLSCDGLYDPSDPAMDAVLTAALTEGASVTISWGVDGTLASGEERYSCSAIIASVELNSGENDDGTYSFTFESTGAVTRTEFSA